MSLGSLVVRLGLDAAEFTSGLTKSEYQARKFAQQIDRQIATGVRVATGAMLAFGAAATVAFKKAVDDLGNFKQISEQIGDTAEAVAALDKAAATSGVSINEVASASQKLTATLSKTDDEGDAAARALKAIGLNLNEFRRLSPVAQLEAVAAAMAKFDDSAGKTAVAMALLGKSGAQALPFLQDLAAQGGRTVQVTQEQIEAADQFSKRLAAMGQELSTVARIIAGDFLQWLERMQKEFQFAAQNVTGFWNALWTLGTLASIDPFKSTTESLREVNAQLREANELASQGGFYGFLNKLAGGFGERAIESLNFKKKFLEFQQGQEAIQRGMALIGPGNDDRLDRMARKARELNFTPPAKGGKSAREQQSDAERYFQTLQRQLQTTQDLTAVEEARMAIARGIKGITPELERQIVLYAEMIDYVKGVAKEEEERKRLMEEEARIRVRTQQMVGKQIDDARREVETIREGNQQIEDQITLLIGGEEAINKVNVARLDNLILLAKEKALMAQNAGASADLVQAYEAEVAALERRKELFAEAEVAKMIRDEAAKLQDLKDSFSDTLVQPLVDFVNQTKSAKDAFKSFIKSIEQMLAQKAARGVADWIFGGNTQSGFDFSTIFKLFGSFMPGYLPPGAAGPPMFAGGTAFAPGGGAWVGETGPEFVSLPAGARVTPATQMRGGSADRPMVFNVNVLPGADTRSAKQVGNVLRDTVMRSIKDR